MPDPTPPPTDPVDPPAPPADPPAPPADDPPADPPALDAAALARELEQARRDAAKYRGEAKTLRDAQRAAEDANKTEDEKRIARIAELEARDAEREKTLRDRTSYAAVVDAAARLGAAKPAMIHKLIEGEIEYEDDGTPKNVDALVKDFLKVNTEFMSTAGRPTGDAGQGARGKSTLTKDQIKSMGDDEINRRWDEVSEVLSRPT